MGALNGFAVLQEVYRGFAAQGQLFPLTAMVQRGSGLPASVTETLRSEPDGHGHSVVWGLMEHKEYLVRTLGRNRWLMSLGEGVQHGVFQIHGHLLAVIPRPDMPTEQLMVAARAMMNFGLTFSLLFSGSDGLLYIPRNGNGVFHEYHKKLASLNAQMQVLFLEYVHSRPVCDGGLIDLNLQPLVREQASYRPEVVPALASLIEKELALIE